MDMTNLLVPQNGITIPVYGIIDNIKEMFGLIGKTALITGAAVMAPRNNPGCAAASPSGGRSTGSGETCSAGMAPISREKRAQ